MANVTQEDTKGHIKLQEFVHQLHACELFMIISIAFRPDVIEMREEISSWWRNRLALLERKFCEEINVPIEFVLPLDEGPRLQMWWTVEFENIITWNLEKYQ